VWLVSAVQKNAAAKLNVIYQNLEFMELGEKRIPRADLTAFVFAVIVEGRTYVGVGKTKKEARCEAAEKALRHLQLWTDADEDNKRMMLYGIDNEDPVEVVMRLRMETGQPLYSSEMDVSDGHSFTPSWDSVYPSGSWDEGHSFSSRGPTPSRFRSPDFRPPMFPPRGRFDGGPRGPRSVAPDPAAFGRGYSGARPNHAGIGRDRSNQEDFSKSYEGAGPNQAGFRRGYDTGPVSRPPRGRGNTSMTRGIPRGPSYPQGGLDYRDNTVNRKVPRVPGPDGVNQFGLPVQNRVEHTNRAISQPQNKPGIRSNKAGTVPARPNNGFTGQVPLRNTAPQTNPATNFNYPPVSSSVPNALHTAVPAVPNVSRTAAPACSTWNPMSMSLVYGQQPNTAASTQTYPNTTTTASNVTPISEQYNTNAAWPDASQADYFAYYNTYLQSMGVSESNSYISMPGSNASSSSFPSSTDVQTDAAYVSMAYANSAAAYYNALYGAGGGGYADPSQSQLYSYLYPYGNNKPT